MGSKTGHIFYKIWLQLITLLFAIEVGHAQNIIIVNPADINDARAQFVNPAIVPFQQPQAILGLKIFHIGFLDNNTYGFKNEFGGVSFPSLFKGHLGLSLNGQAFNTPFYNQTNYSLTVSQKLGGSVALGARVNIFTKSYNRDQFDPVAELDPVFADGTSKLTYSLGAGLFFMPVPNFSLGLSFDHLTRPNISLLDDEVWQPLSTDFGIRYSNKFLSLLASFNYTEEELISNFGLEARFEDRGKLRLGYGTQSFKVEGQLYLFGGLSLNYSWDYPMSVLNEVSFGSHQVSLIYQLGWLRLQSFDVTSSVRTMEIVEQKKTIIISEDVTLNELAVLSDADLEFPEETKRIIYSKSASKTLNQVLPDSEAVKHLTPRYKQSVDEISQQLEARKDLRIDIITPSGTEDRALAVKNRIINDWGVSSAKVRILVPGVSVTPGDDGHSDSLATATASKLDSIREIKKYKEGSIIIEESYHTLSHDSTIFQITSITRKRGVTRWHLVIEKPNGWPVRRISGWRKVPRELAWNWTNDAGGFIEPGLYVYYFEWRDTNGQIRQSSKKAINVQKVKRDWTIEITKKSKPSGKKRDSAKVEKIQLELKKLKKQPSGKKRDPGKVEKIQLELKELKKQP